jgi:hypothetical protein
MYAYMFKFTGEGVFMYKKKDGGIACQTYRQIAARAASNGQISTPPINTPSSSWGRVRTSPTIVHL